ncbi:MAG TPA: TonB-dependent receptor [Saprospiraceae bacterium]|nr:TonB-dependent receptor [Saprospiraceae bacterium]HMQ82928.1 TonB-dependent receptor [Saprospiraceae bacterium]
MQKYYLLALLLCASASVQAQDLTQVVRGTVVDAESQFPLIGVNVAIPSENGSFVGGSTDVDGRFRIEGVPLGRCQIELSYLGYETVLLSDIQITSAKEVILHIPMSETATQLATVEITATQQTGEVRNEMALVSARQFSVKETDRYAGSRGEPARMASNFAGVQGADDSRNDLIVRGNAPNGVLWRLEGINIPNPNHFGIPGTGGGPVTIINNKFLANSDFFTGAFPAEYGNGLAGVFDLRMRNGNNERSEQSAQIGFLGTDLMAEGPINRKNSSSYLAMFRYSTLELFSFLGIDVGTDALPKYFDGAFRLNFPTKNNGSFSLWGLGGASTIDIKISDEVRPDTTTLIYGDNDRDQYFSSHMFAVGATYTQALNPNTFFKGGLAVSQSGADAFHDYIYRHLEGGEYVIDSLPKMLDYDFKDTKYSAYAFVNHKLNRKATLKAGLNADLMDMNYLDSVRALDGTDRTLAPWRVRWNSRESAVLLQPYAQLKMVFDEHLSATLGWTALYFSLNNNSFSPLEPRLGLSYAINQRQKLNLGIGLHSQIQSPYLYFFSDSLVNGQLLTYNRDVGLSKSWHFVLGYDHIFGNDFRLKLETYYQYLFDIPVDIMPSSFSFANAGTGFARLFPQEVVNEGTGRNYGLELTFEKFFSKGYYFLLTGSVFDATYEGSDGIERNITFNGRYAFNVLFAKEFSFKNGTALNIGGKYTRSGGRWYGPVDEAASAREVQIVYLDDQVNTLQFPDYERFDIRIAYNWNRPKVSHEFALDLVNVFDIQNILTLTYAPDNPLGPIREEYQLGRLPIFYYKIDF